MATYCKSSLEAHTQPRGITSAGHAGAGTHRPPLPWKSMNEKVVKENVRGMGGINAPVS